MSLSYGAAVPLVYFNFSLIFLNYLKLIGLFLLYPDPVSAFIPLYSAKLFQPHPTSSLAIFSIIERRPK